MKKIVLLILLLFTICQSQIYQIPPIISQQEANIRLDEIYYLNEPSLKLNKIYKKEVFERIHHDEKQKDNKNSKTKLIEFKPCSQSPPEIEFSYLGHTNLQKHYVSKTSSRIKNYPLVFDYEQLKQQYKNIVDMVFYDNHIFTISTTGVIRIYRLDEMYEGGIILRDSINAINWKQLQKNISQEKGKVPQWISYKNIGKGFFQFMNGNDILLFVNGRVLIVIDMKTFKVTLLSHGKSASKAYHQLANFESVTKINESHFAILDRKFGAIVYKITKISSNKSPSEFSYNLRKIYRIDKASFNGMFQQDQQMTLMDIKYNPVKKYLLLLDYEKGVFTFNQQLVQIQGKQDELQVETRFVLNPNVILKKQCNLMEISPLTESIYIVCNKIHHISLEKWPIIEEKTYPHPMINIREIFIQQDQNIVILAGYEVFKVLYLDRPTAYFRDEMLDKIVFYKDVVITANQYHIVAYNFEVQKPQIICQTKNASYIGLHNLVLKTQAECLPEYLQKINKKKQQKPEFQPEDVCVYTIYKNVYVWEKGELPVQWLIILVVSLAVFGVLMLVWYLTMMWRAKRAIAYMISLGGDSTVKLVEQKAQRSQNFKETADNINVQTGQTEAQLNKNGESQFQPKL